MTKRQLRKQLKEFSHKTEPSTTLYSGALGIYIGGHQYVDVPNRPGFVYVRLRNNTSELIQAHNEVVSPVYGLPVILVRNKTYYEIYGRDSVQYASYWDSSSSYLPKHGHQHEFDPNNNGGGDLVFVHGEQFYPMMTFPSGTDGGNTVLIAPYRYYYNSAWHYAGDTGAGNLLQYGPTGASNAKLLLVGIDATTGNPFVKLGSEFDASITGAAAMTSYVPTNITQSTEIPGAIVRLVTGTATITWANIYDARQYMGILQAAGGATTFLGLTDTPSSYAGQADKIVTVNSAANALEFRTNTGSFSSGGGGSQLGIYGQDEAVGLGTGTTLNVVGSDISLSISGTVLTLLHSDPTGTPHSFLDLTDTPDSYSGQGSKFVAVNSGATALEFVTAPAGGGGGGSGLVIYDDSVYKVTGTAISFDSNLSVAVTGSVAFVSTSTPSTLAFGKIHRQVQNYNTGSTSFVDIDPTFGSITLSSDFSHRYKAGWSMRGGNNTNGGGIAIDLVVDNVRVAANTQGLLLVVVPSATNNTNLSDSFVTNVLTTGSHTFKMQYAAVTAGTAQISASTGSSPYIFWVEELNISS